MATRRHFLQFCGCVSLVPGVALSASPFCAASRRRHSGSVQLAGTIKTSDEHYGVGRLGVGDSNLKVSSLPGRGHDCVFSATRQQLVVFSRRPGNWFYVFNKTRGQGDITVFASAGRHFYGHGRFSADGSLFFATENDYDNATGMIGVYAVTDSFRRIREFPSYGVGPHDLAIGTDETTLLVANGGIETHPDFGREKLNLTTMRSSLAMIDSRTGQLMRQYNLPDSAQRLSIRHLALSANGDCFFAGQYQGATEDTPPLVGCWRRQGEFQLWASPRASQILNNYVTSVAVDPSGTTVATTSARGGAIIFWHASSGEIFSVHHLDDCSGVAATADCLYTTSSAGMHIFSLQGELLSGPYPFSGSVDAWDNHLAIASS